MQIFFSLLLSSCVLFFLSLCFYTQQEKMKTKENGYYVHNCKNRINNHK
ncbi:unnamed protein product [Schistosoma margrebowiei]|uniref:Uncharacterized protein n=1 Tax=Schistosoma margrebowiei TaxID=48269 RepID=A0A183LWB5_9TREM|nr:unnamed protein product [Schistosoma margrebowiei]